MVPFPKDADSCFFLGLQHLHRKFCIIGVGEGGTFGRKAL